MPQQNTDEYLIPIYLCILKAICIIIINFKITRPYFADKALAGLASLLTHSDHPHPCSGILHIICPLFFSLEIAIVVFLCL